MMNWKKLTFVFAFSVVALGTWGQTAKDIILTVEDEQVTREDFESIFRKNNRDSVITKDALDDYMELFINFKLKVREAKELGLDTASSFKKELAGYRKQLARPYLIDTELLDELIQEAYQRKQEEIRASHILIKVGPNDPPSDTLRAYERIMRLRERIMNGTDFSMVARSKDGSEDPSAKDNAGDLGFFTAFQMVYPFEEAAYNLEIGEVSMPVRTRYGYHLVKVTDRRQARGEVLASHIMIRMGEKSNAEQMQKAEEKINEIHDLLKNGADFSELAVKYSEDASTAQKGGELPWFGTGKMVEEFENAAFDLTENGQISEPFRSPYGWHIVKRIDYKPIPTFETVKGELKNKISRDSRSEMTKQSFLAKLRKEYNVQQYPKALKPIYKAAAVDSAFTKGINVKKEKKLQKPLFSINGEMYPAMDFYTYLKKAKIKNPRGTSNEIVDAQLEKYIDSELMDYENGRLESKYDDFRLLMNEYHDGILLFELTDQKVWSKAVKDTTGLEAFYADNMDKFMWNERADATIYTCADAAVAKKLRKALSRGKTPNEIAEQLNKKSQLNLSYQEETFEKGKNELLDSIEWKEGLSENIEKNGQVMVVQINKITPPTAKTIDEARGLITAEYQNFLEENWINSLREKYKYTVNKDVLYSIQ